MEVVEQSPPVVNEEVSENGNGNGTIRAFEEETDKQKYLRLTFLLEKTSLYSNFLSQKLNLEKNSNNGGKVEEKVTETVEEPKGKRKRNGKKQKVKEKEEIHPKKKGKSNGKTSTTKTNGVSKEETESALISTADSAPGSTFSQPVLVTGGTLRAYQLRGVEWMISLYENGLNGILADEMGLGKTIQCIGLLSHLIYQGVKGPFLIVGPLSTLGNWVKEFGKWAPDIPVLMYHGTKEERTQLRTTKLKNTHGVKGLPINSMYPIVITSYEMAMNDRKFLGKLKWKYLIVDEGHRIKNLNCKLIRELKAYSSNNRLLLTGTPLQNNLTELWSLLNFLLPDIFDDLQSFQSWFDFSSIGEEGGEQVILEQEQRNQVVTKLHQILRPFLLRRVKDDVELDIPSKSEKVIHTSLTDLQQKYYAAIMNKQLDQILSAKAIKALRNKGSSLQNMLMQLRKTCNHPYLFEFPYDENDEPIIDENIILASGKMQILDRLLNQLKKNGDRVLIFSQMTKMLDLLEDYMDYRKYKCCRLDGSSAQVDRQSNIDAFTKDDDIFCFLLSTRAGGLGINLTSANIVIFFDNDWNPQADLQAQDRCHRIGQTKPVRVYRLATANSVETKMLERANNKLKLDRLVIQKGNFLGAKSKSGITEISELEELLSGSFTLAGHADEITDEELFTWNDTGSDEESKDE